jgi:hypothetical protein
MFSLTYAWIAMTIIKRTRVGTNEIILVNLGHLTAAILDLAFLQTIIRSLR